MIILLYFFANLAECSFLAHEEEKLFKNTEFWDAFTEKDNQNVHVKEMVISTLPQNMTLALSTNAQVLFPDSSCVPFHLKLPPHSIMHIARNSSHIIFVSPNTTNTFHCSETATFHVRNGFAIYSLKGHNISILSLINNVVEDQRKLVFLIVVGVTSGSLFCCCLFCVITRIACTKRRRRTKFVSRTFSERVTSTH